MSHIPILYTTCESPIGTFVIGARESGIISVRIMTEDGQFGPSDHWRRADDDLRSATDQIEEYFAGERVVFDLPLELRGTSFQQRAWIALQDVPYGETVTYAELAARIGTPRASRAIGLAMQRNPFTLVVPCHRVIGSGGELRGYLNGLETKRWLLEHERSQSAQPLQAAMP